MKDKTILVTGAAMGIGLACSEEFARSGATVILADLNFPDKQAEKLQKAGYAAMAYKCDVANEHEVKEMVDWIVKQYGRLDGL